MEMKFIHPFPARMAPSLALRALPTGGKAIRVLDPMMGSGTAIVSARVRGHEGVGVDRDPLAVLIAQASSRDLDVALLKREATKLLNAARDSYRGISQGDAYPLGANEDTRKFVRYWFDPLARRQLAALTEELNTGAYRLKTFLKIAISRMIITKQGGVSLAEDVSHSRPHRTRDFSPVLPLDLFPRSVAIIANNAQFQHSNTLPQARAIRGDCRRLPFEDGEFDYILTSPPYLNAIDYLRGHKLSLVWLGHQIDDLRDVRSTNIGSDRGANDEARDHIIDRMVRGAELSSKLQNTLRLYARDLESAISEMYRVLKFGGTALFVIGDCTIRGVEVRNSLAIDMIAKEIGFERISRRRRPLRAGRRYLPPPSKASAKQQLQRRMWDEIILKYRAT